MSSMKNFISLISVSYTHLDVYKRQPLALEYLIPIKFVIPCFLFTQMLAAFLRNDNSPTLATVAVLLGGVFNIFGDYTFVDVYKRQSKSSSTV